MNKKHPQISENGRFAKLASMGEMLFHAGDLAVLWNIGNKQTLYQTLSRYAAAGLIFRVHKGFYSMKDPKGLDPYFLGVKAVHGSAYVSCESVLAEHGIINQSPREVTLVSASSRRFETGGARFRSRQLAPRFLYNPAGIETRNGVPVATAPRAVADMLYFNPRAHFDAGASGLIDWKRVRAVAEKVGYNIRIPR